MKKIYLLSAGVALLSLSSCIQEFEPQSGSVTEEQAANAPGSYSNFVAALTSNVCGQWVFSGSSYQQPNDFGYPAVWVRRDVTGNDIVCVGGGYNWFNTWYQCGVSLAPIYLNSQYPWTFYYVGIKSCNTVMNLAGDTPDDSKKVGAGIAHVMRALYNLDLAQMYAPKSFGEDPESPTVPIINDRLNLDESTEIPRAPMREMFAWILADLDQAEALLDGYARPDRYTPDVTVVNGLRARVYLLMEDWANAEKYAKLAQQGYAIMTAAEYTDRNHGFNDANYTNSWMLACRFKKDSQVMVDSEGNHSWGSWYICELPPDTYGYYNTYGAGNYIDRHLYNTIPATDARKKCWVDFSVDDLESKAEIITALSAYSDVPENVFGTGQNVLSNTSGAYAYGGMPLKFRAKDGNHTDNLDAYCVDLPMMRVEEMVLIEAEAAGRQNEERGKQLLTAFAQTRDPNYVYGQHNEAYNNSSTPAFVNEVWWQRRVEFWGEGLAMYDIKRLNKGIIRSYPETNHVKGYRWNTNTPPQWMTFCIVQTETNYNGAVVNNPTPVAPSGDSPEHIW